jgi:hypothetical protein
MSEMLGNHFYLSRDLAQAIDAYSKAFGDNIVLSGVYIPRMAAGTFNQTQKMLLLK